MSAAGRKEEPGIARLFRLHCKSMPLPGNTLCWRGEALENLT